MVPAMVFILEAEWEGRVTDFDRLDGDTDGLASTAVNLDAATRTYLYGEVYVDGECEIPKFHNSNLEMQRN